MTEIAAYLKEARKSAAGSADRAALRQVEAIGLPTNKLEDWRYTDLRPLRKEPFKTLSDRHAATEIGVPEPLSSWPRLVLLNGHFLPEMSDDLSGTGIELKDAVPAAGPAADGIEALNCVLAGKPFQMTVGSGPEIKGLELTLIFDGTSEQAVHARSFLRLAAKASLDLWIRVVTSGPLGWINLVNQIEVEKDGQVRIFADINPIGSGFVTIADSIRLAEGAQCEHHSIRRSAASLRHNIRVNLAGRRAGIRINGAALAGRHQTLATVTEVSHNAPDASSRQDFRNVAAEKGTASFQGRVVVCAGANGTDAHQSNKNLLIHPSAKATAKPELLIDADDVQCSHGSATGQLDEAAIFYLGQRGIPELRARTLLTNAFLADIFERMPNLAFADFCQSLSDRWLAEHLGSET
jgi:Fe-S cluster assembly protein SufD